jgi:hypothetical protein
MAYGLGIMHRTDLDGFTHAGHGGNLIHFHSDMIFCLDSGLGVFVSTNSLTGAGVVPVLASAILQAAIFEKTGELILPDPIADPAATPVAMPSEELKKLAGIYSLAGSGLSALVYTEGFGLHIDGVPVPFVPLSDGSFDMGGTRFWFIPVEYEHEGETLEVVVVAIGPLQHLIGQKMNPAELSPVDETLAPWLGTYVAQQTPENISIISALILRECADGFAEAQFFTLNGQAPVAPLISIDGAWFLGVSDPMTFHTAEDTAILVISGVTFVRVE